jgi:hypothetical protein
VKRSEFERCPIHGSRITGGPELYRCRHDGGHPVRLPSLETDVIDWPAICDGCGTKRSVTAISDWLSTDARLDFHLCPRCERRVSRQILRRAVGPEIVRFARALWRRR